MTDLTELLRSAYAALNRNDIEGFMSIFDPAIVRVEPDGFPHSGIYRGLASVKDHVMKGRGTWAEGSCEPKHFTVDGNIVILQARVRVRLNGETDWLEGEVGDVFTFRDGKAIEYRTFASEQEALDWVKENSPEPGPR